MINCTSEVISILSVIKTFLNIVKYIMPIVLIVYCTIDVFKIIISKKDDDVKKYRKNIFDRVIGCIILLLIPTIVFLLLDLLINDNISNVASIKECWNLVE